MDAQEFLTLLLILAAAVYLGRIAVAIFLARGAACGSGCGKCAADSIEEKSKRKSLPMT